MSALVPCYNSASFLGKTLESLRTQTWPNLEILIGDDCSTDNTPEIVTQFAHENRNVRVLKRTENLGWLANSNDLMANAAGEYMFFAFHDDIVAPTYVEKLARKLLENQHAVMAYSDMQVFQVDGEMSEHSFPVLSGNLSRLQRGLIMVAMPENWWVPNRGLFRASAFHKTGGIRPNRQGEYSADWTWLLHLSLIGEFHRVPEILCWKYYKSKSISKQWDRNIKQKIAVRLAGVTVILNSSIDLSAKIVLVSTLLAKDSIKLTRFGIKNLFSGKYLKDSSDLDSRG